MMKSKYHMMVWSTVLALCLSVCWAAHAAELDEFLARIADPSADVRADAWKAAGPFGAAAVKPLAELAAAEDPGVAKAALAAIGTIAAYGGSPEGAAEQKAIAQSLGEAVEAVSDDQLRRELLHYLGLVATDAQVPLLGGLLADPAVGEDARIALERIPGDLATRALTKALQAPPEEVQIRVAESLARRGDASVVPMLVEVAKNAENRRVAFACLEALGAFGVPPHRVFPRRPSFTPEERVQYVRAALEAAYHLRQDGETEEAIQIYENISAYSNEPAHLREALLGLAATNADAFAAQALGYLFHPGVSAAAYGALVSSSQEGMNDKLVLAYEKSDPARKAALLQILHRRGADSLPRLLELAGKDESPEVRATADVLAGRTPSFEDVLTVAKFGSEWTRPQALDIVQERIAEMITSGDTDRARTTCIDLLKNGLPEAYAVAAFSALERVPGSATAAYLDTLGLWEARPESAPGSLSPAVCEAAQRAYVACAAANEDVETAKERLFLAAEQSAYPSVTGMAVEKLASMGVDSKALAKRKGFITDWRIIGPFPNANNSAFGRSFLDEAACTGKAPVEFEGKVYEWAAAETDSVPAAIGLRGRLEPSENVAAYAYAELQSPDARDVMFMIGSDDGCEFWVNGAKMHATDTPRGMAVDQDKINATLVAGVNRVLIKVLQGAVDWQFCVRVTDRAGVPIDLSE